MYAVYRTSIGQWMHNRSLAAWDKGSHSLGEGAHEDGTAGRTDLVGDDADQVVAEVHAIPYLEDNYAYLIVDRASSGNYAAVVDPGDANAVVRVARRLGVTITHALLTHSHHDHAGGNLELKALVPGVQIVSFAEERSPGTTQLVENGDVIEVGSLRFKVVATPCHTVGHICFYLDCSEVGAAHSVAPTELPCRALFSGDTLFVGGCGKFFEGGADEMAHSLSVCAQFPKDTAIFCGHENTLNNLKFGAFASPDNDAITHRLAWAESRRGAGITTIPSTIGAELNTNVFMLSRGDPSELQRLRDAKDNDLHITKE